MIRCASLSLLLLLLSLTSVVYAGHYDSKNIKALNANNFKQTVVDNEKASMAVFYAPWCGHCKSLEPAYEKAAANLRNLVSFVAVDCDKQSNKQLCSEFNVQGFPTIKYFQGKKRKVPKDYNGERTAKALADYALVQFALASCMLFGAHGGDRIDWMPSHVKIVKGEQDVSNLTTSQSSKPVSLLLTTASKITPLYKALSADFKDQIDFYAAKDADDLASVKSSLKITKVPSLVVLSDGQSTLYEGKLGYDGLHSFLSKAVSKKGKSEL